MGLVEESGARALPRSRSPCGIRRSRACRSLSGRSARSRRPPARRPDRPETRSRGELPPTAVRPVFHSAPRAIYLYRCAKAPKWPPKSRQMSYAPPDRPIVRRPRCRGRAPRRRQRRGARHGTSDRDGPPPDAPRRRSHFAAPRAIYLTEGRGAEVVPPFPTFVLRRRPSREHWPAAGAPAPVRGESPVGVRRCWGSE
jgi:hypothetical protein